MSETPPLIRLLQTLSGREDAALRYLTPQQQRRMNVPNAMVDAIPVPGSNRLRPSRYMWMPQGTYQALEALTRDTGVVWPENTQATALMTLLHEAGHMRGGKFWQNERRQQAFALDKYLWAAKQLGIEKEKRRRMYQQVLKYTNSLPPDYRPLRPRELP